MLQGRHTGRNTDGDNQFPAWRDVCMCTIKMDPHAKAPYSLCKRQSSVCWGSASSSFTLCHLAVSLQTPLTARSNQQAVNSAACSPHVAPRRVTSAADITVSEISCKHTQSCFFCLSNIIISHVLLQGFCNMKNVWSDFTKHSFDTNMKVTEVVVGAQWAKTESRAAAGIWMRLGLQMM